MVNVRGFGRLGTLAVGLGIGAAVSHSPVACADSSTDWLSSIDSVVSGGALPAPALSGLNLSISFDGYSLINEGSASASSQSGDFGLAIAYGADSNAVAAGGTGDFALADGAGAGAFSGADGGTGNNFDSAIDIGSGASDSDYVEAGSGSYDSAIRIGDNTGTGDEVFAIEGDHDTAIDVGNNSGGVDGVYADYGNDNTAIADGNYAGNLDGTFAGNGNDNFADVVGNQSQADAGGVDSGPTSDGNVAYVLDPTGTDGSTAEAGGTSTAAGGYDLAAVLGVDDKLATATGSQFLYDIVTALGNESGTAASTGGGLLGELASLF
jgi:hypothetical protein